MLRGFISSACRWLQEWNESFQCPHQPPPELFSPFGPRTYQRVERVLVTEEVSRTLFQDFDDHLQGPRGEEEIGWVLLGLREEREIVVLATLPAGANREAGVAHVRFNASAQALASRIVRQQDRRLGIVGVVHTHPGSLRHPSEGDFQGDSVWVQHLRGGDGVFGIGTNDYRPSNGHTPEHIQAQGELCFSWYALANGDRKYRRLPIQRTPGPDLARPLHPLWNTIEAHADTLDDLCRLLTPIRFEIVEEDDTRALALKLVLHPGLSLRLLLQHRKVRYYLERQGEVTAIDPEETQVDRAVFLILAELAHTKNRSGPRAVAGSARR